MPFIAGRFFGFGAIKFIAHSAVRPPEAGRGPLLFVFAIVRSFPESSPWLNNSLACGLEPPRKLLALESLKSRL